VPLLTSAQTGSSFSRKVLVPVDLILAILAVVVFLVLAAWGMRKASKRMDETTDFDHKTGLPRWFG
jgi:cytochrome oxidase assembly protein ShyY1